jgi:hypothetical protein
VATWTPDQAVTGRPLPCGHFVDYQAFCWRSWRLSSPERAPSAIAVKVRCACVEASSLAAPYRRHNMAREFSARHHRRTSARHERQPCRHSNQSPQLGQCLRSERVARQLELDRAVERSFPRVATSSSLRSVALWVSGPRSMRRGCGAISLARRRAAAATPSLRAPRNLVRLGEARCRVR